MDREKLKFKLELYATMWNKPPIVDISIDDKSYFNSKIESTKDSPTTIEFTVDLELEKSHKLIITRSGKGKNQTVIDDRKIVKDQLLHIKNIEIDEIDLGNLVFEGIYQPDYPEPWATQQAKIGNELPKSIKNSPNLGHNGTWTFEFVSPFYMWLLENLY